MDFDKCLSEIRRKMEAGMADYEWCLSRWERLGKTSKEFHQEFFPIKLDGKDDDGYPSYVHYGTLLQSMVEVVLQKDEGSYQGDTWALIRRGDSFGVVTFGWGSCSGCDALEARYGDPDGIQELRDNLIQQSRWGSPDEILAYLKNHDWEGDWSSSYSRACPEFVTECTEIPENTLS